jgi:rare lipoprotein A
LPELPFPPGIVIFAFMVFRSVFSGCLFVQCLLVFLISTLVSTSSFSQPASQDGKASYYARKFQGRMTASGELFDTFDYTAAHRSLPFNTYVNVVNTKNNLNVIVRVNDRGPFAKNRVIDLSESAARRIGGYQHGLVHVRIEVLDLLLLTPALDSIFSTGEVHDCLGNEAELKGKSISLWRSFDLLHALYVANDLYLKEDVQKVLIVTRKQSGRKLFHIVLSDYDTDTEVVQAKDLYEKKGFMEVQFFNP